ncbi:MAG: N5-glutamine methyltransferase family protein [Clostridium sp.]
MSEMKSAVGAGMDRSGDDLCVENSVREFKIWADVLNYGKKILKNAGIVEADLDAWYLFEQIFGISRAQYFMCARENIAGSTAQKMAAQEQTGNSLESKNALDCVELWLKEKLSAYENTLEKRASRIPLQQILGQQEFMGLTFFVNEHVLIPRQDTETLVELVLNEQKDKNVSILDMCTGSGCIAVSLKKLGGYACVEGADISEEALKVAKRNSEEILENRDVNSSRTGVIFRRSDMFSAFPETERFNVIVSTLHPQRCYRGAGTGSTGP